MLYLGFFVGCVSFYLYRGFFSSLYFFELYLIGFGFGLGLYVDVWKIIWVEWLWNIEVRDF